MFKLEYVDSADPLIRIVTSDPGAVFDRPYMGYLLFLFGEADLDTAAWIREHLQALDSLTGPDIAGAVFVKSFEIEAHVKRFDTPRPSALKIENRKIDLRDVNYVARPQFMVRPMFDERGNLEPRARSSLESLKATTYASDEIARSLGLIADLPCIVFLDAVPSEARPLRLDERNLTNAIRIIRETLGRFMQAPGFAEHRDLLNRAHDLGCQIRRLRASLQDLATSKQAELRQTSDSLPEQLLGVRTALLGGSARKFVYGLRKTTLDKRVIEDAVLRAKGQAESLSHVARTIRAISWYADTESSPIAPDDLARISRIYRDHVLPLSGANRPTNAEFDRNFLMSTLGELRTIFLRKIEAIWGDLPIPEVMRENQNRKAATVSEVFEARRLSIEETLHCTSAELADVLCLLASGPRLTESFAAITLARGIDGTESKASGQNILEAALRSMTAGAVTFNGRDIYIGTNVAAMGPYASATNTVFGGG